MKTITIDRQIEIIREMFDTYIEPLASSFMSGEVPSTVFRIVRKGTRENDWLAFVRFKNTLTISVFRCEVYLDDIVRFCRLCKIWLITDPVYKIVATYFMMHPLYQSQCIDFTHDNLSDYESMLVNAGKLTKRFIKRYFKFEDPVQNAVLTIMDTYMKLFTNQTEKRNLNDVMEEARQKYVNAMLRDYSDAYHTAIHFKAFKTLVNSEGFIVLEHRKTSGYIDYIGQDDPEEILKHYQEFDNSYDDNVQYYGKKAFSKKPPKKGPVKLKTEADLEYERTKALSGLRRKDG